MAKVCNTLSCNKSDRKLSSVLIKHENITFHLVFLCFFLIGLVQFVESISLADILHRSTLLAYLQLKAPSPNSPMGVQKDVMETYIRSCGMFLCYKEKPFYVNKITL